MILLTTKISLQELEHIEPTTYFDGWIKCVADLDRELLAVNASMHADLEEYLLSQGSEQKNLYGFNILFDPFEIEYDSIINAPRNRADGFPRDGRGVSSPTARKKIEEIIHKWVNC
ncbi:MAG: DUF5674 family protein [Lachnospiraceae bacterium]|nr:DUF5674 family protein [Lachnospiraceae bacterium]